MIFNGRLFIYSLGFHILIQQQYWLSLRSYPCWISSNKKWSISESTWLPSSNHWKPVWTQWRGWKKLAGRKEKMEENSMNGWAVVVAHKVDHGITDLSCSGSNPTQFFPHIFIFRSKAQTFKMWVLSEMSELHNMCSSNFCNPLFFNISTLP